MINQIFNLDSFKILSLFSLSQGSRFRRKEIKERTRLNNIPLDKTLLKLLSGKILKKEGNLYMLNFENKNTKKMMELISKQYINLKELPFDVYLLLLDITSEFSIIKGVEIYLFGSYSKLIFNENSDVDLAILTTDNLDKMKIKRKVRKMEKLYGKSVELHFFAKKLFYKNKKDPLVKEILKNGLKLL